MKQKCKGRNIMRWLKNRGYTVSLHDSFLDTSKYYISNGEFFTMKTRGTGLFWFQGICVFSQAELIKTMERSGKFPEVMCSDEK